MTTNKEIVKNEKKQLTVRTMMEGDKFKDAIQAALPETGCTMERFARVAMTVLNKTPKIADCTPASVAQCMIDCASLGIEPDGRRAHLIPYGNKCTLILDYKGIVELVKRSGEVLSIQAHVVYENDEFNYLLGTNPTLDHKPTLEDRGKPVAAYSCVILKDHSASFEVMGVDEINKVRDDSKGYKKNDPSVPWNKWWAEMARKTVFKRHSKWLTLSPEVHEAINREDSPVPVSMNEKAEIAKPVMDTAETLFSTEPVEAEISSPSDEQS
jgi:recombination protein RecT